jgi:hypothetical protein
VAWDAGLDFVKHSDGRADLPRSAIAALVAIMLHERRRDRLRASGSECARPAHARAMPEVVARRVIEMALHGLRDPKELADKAVRFLATNSRYSAAAGPQDASDLLLS